MTWLPAAKIHYCYGNEMTVIRCWRIQSAVNRTVNNKYQRSMQQCSSFFFYYTLYLMSHCCDKVFLKLFEHYVYNITVYFGREASYRLKNLHDVNSIGLVVPKTEQDLLLDLLYIPK